MTSISNSCAHSASGYRLADFSRTADTLLAPVFGADCRLLNRGQAFLLAQAAMSAAECDLNLFSALGNISPEGLRELSEEFLDLPTDVNVALDALGVGVSTQQLALMMLDDECGLLGLARFLTQELESGRWESLAEPYLPLVTKEYDSGYVKTQIENLKSYRPGSAPYVEILWRIGTHLEILPNKLPSGTGQRYSMAASALKALVVIEPDLSASSSKDSLEPVNLSDDFAAEEKQGAINHALDTYWSAMACFLRHECAELFSQDYDRVIERIREINPSLAEECDKALFEWDAECANAFKAMDEMTAFAGKAWLKNDSSQRQKISPFWVDLLCHWSSR